MPIFNISFQFDSVTEIVTELSCKIAEQKANKVLVEPTSTPISLSSGTLKLSDATLNALEVNVGDKLVLKVTKGVITLNKGATGNVISKNNSISCKGKIQDSIREIGEQFTYEKSKDGLILIPITKAKTKIDEEIAELFPEEDGEYRSVQIEQAIIEQLGDELDDFDFEFEFNK